MKALVGLSWKLLKPIEPVEEALNKKERVPCHL